MPVLPYLLRQIVAHFAECGFGFPYTPDHRGELFFVHGERRVRPTKAPVRGEVLLHHRRAEGDRRTGADIAHRVVGESCLYAPAAGHVRDGQQVRVLNPRGVFGRALEKRDVAIPGPAAGLNRVRDFVLRRNAGRDYHGLVFARRIFDERNIRDLEGGDFVDGIAEFFKEVHRSPVKGRGEHCDAKRAGIAEQLFMPFPGRVCLLVEFVERCPVPESSLLYLEILVVTVKRYRVGGIGLELHRIRPGFFRGPDYCQSVLQLVVMVRRKLRDYERPAHLFSLGIYLNIFMDSR